jgi:hypothetical protein
MRDFLIWMGAATIAMVLAAYDDANGLNGDAVEVVQTTALIYLATRGMPTRSESKERTDA